MSAGTHVKSGQGKSLWVLGDRLTFKTTPDMTGGRFGFAETSTIPGGGPPPHLHNNEDEVFYILDGNMEFLVGDKILQTPPGSLVFAPRRVIHQFRNKGPGDATFLVWVQPGKFDEFITALGTPAEGVATAPPIDPAIMERLGRLCPQYGIEIHPDAPQAGAAPTQLPPQAYWVLGSHVKMLCMGAQSKGTLCITEITSAPGAGTPPHLHRDAEELVYVLDGKLEFLLGDRTVIGQRGDVVHVPKQTLHSFRNIGAKDGRFVSYHTPAGMEHFFAECGTPALAGSTCPKEMPDPQSIVAIGRKCGIEMSGL